MLVTGTPGYGSYHSYDVVSWYHWTIIWMSIVFRCKFWCVKRRSQEVHNQMFVDYLIMFFGAEQRRKLQLAKTWLIRNRERPLLFVMLIIKTQLFATYTVVTAYVFRFRIHPAMYLLEIRPIHIAPSRGIYEQKEEDNRSTADNWHCTISSIHWKRVALDTTMSQGFFSVGVKPSKHAIYSTSYRTELHLNNKLSVIVDCNESHVSQKQKHVTWAPSIIDWGFVQHGISYSIFYKQETWAIALRD